MEVKEYLIYFYIFIDVLYKKYVDIRQSKQTIGNPTEIRRFEQLQCVEVQLDMRKERKKNRRRRKWIKMEKRYKKSRERRAGTTEADRGPDLQDGALLLLCFLFLRGQGGPGGCLEDLSDTLVQFGGTFHVGQCSDFIGHLLTFGGGDRLLAELGQPVDCLGVVSQVDFAPDQDDRHALAEVQHL